MAARALAFHGATTPCGTTGGNEPPDPLSCNLRRRFRISLGFDVSLSLDVPLNRVHQRDMIKLSRQKQREGHTHLAQGRVLLALHHWLDDPDERLCVARFRLCRLLLLLRCGLLRRPLNPQQLRNVQAEVTRAKDGGLTPETLQRIEEAAKLL